MSQLFISCQFDAGAIEVQRLDSARHIELRIRRDSAADFTQWFHFALHGARGQSTLLQFVNAGQCSYPKGWEHYRVAASYDRRHWFRVDTRFDGGVMSAQFTPDSDCVYLAYFEPYSWEQHLDLVAGACAHPCVQWERLGSTVQGRDMGVLRVTAPGADQPDPEQRKKVWLIARQHPGETMAEWFVEGFLERLLDTNDAVSRRLLQQCVFYVVPNMNPDGAVLGNLRTNAAGANLNREWLAPSMERSPEVALVRQKMLDVGVDCFLDAHGDESLPFVFVVGTEGVPNYSPYIADLEARFKNAWMVACPDFQDTHHYEDDAPGQANLCLATNWVGEQFRCLAYTIEMPFKDNANAPDPEVGWSGERSKRLGASVLQPLLAVL